MSGSMSFPPWGLTYSTQLLLDQERAIGLAQGSFWPDFFHVTNQRATGIRSHPHRPSNLIRALSPWGGKFMARRYINFHQDGRRFPIRLLSIALLFFKFIMLRHHPSRLATTIFLFTIKVTKSNLLTINQPDGKMQFRFGKDWPGKAQ